jgi:hypothetical protein
LVTVSVSFVIGACGERSRIHASFENDSIFGTMSPNVHSEATPKNLLALDEKADASHSLSMTSKSAAGRFSFSAGVHSS